MFALAALQVLERCALVGAAFEFVRDSREAALGVAVGLAGLVALHGAVRAALARHVRLVLIDSTVSGLLGGDVLKASALPDEDALMATFNGLVVGERLLSEYLPGLLGDGVAAVLLGAAVALEAKPRLVIVGAAALVVAAAGVLVARRVTARLVATADEAYVPVVDGLVTAFGARLEIAASGRARDFQGVLRERAEHWCKVALRSDRLSALAGRAPLVAAALAVALATLVDQALRGSVTSAAVGDAALLASVVPAYTGLIRRAFETVRSNVKVASLVDLIESSPAPRGRAAVPLPALPADVEWRDVSFAYASDAGRPGVAALDKVNIHWPSGKTLVLAGPNGSGKSTVLRLLLGLAKPTSGRITVGGIDLHDLDLTDWRRKVAFLPQRPYVPERASVREFVRLLAWSATDKAIRASLERVGLVGDGGDAAPLFDRGVATFSAGERQRLALARTLCQDAEVVVLDEPDANLDARGIALVALLVRELARDRMVAVAAHTQELLGAGEVVELRPDRSESVSARRRAGSPR